MVTRSRIFKTGWYTSCIILNTCQVCGSIRILFHISMLLSLAVCSSPPASPFALRWHCGSPHGSLWGCLPFSQDPPEQCPCPTTLGLGIRCSPQHSAGWCLLLLDWRLSQTCSRCPTQFSWRPHPEPSHSSHKGSHGPRLSQSQKVNSILLSRAGSIGIESGVKGW
jgi:hypothetical protein